MLAGSGTADAVVGVDALLELPLELPPPAAVTAVVADVGGEKSASDCSLAAGPDEAESDAAAGELRDMALVRKSV